MPEARRIALSVFTGGGGVSLVPDHEARKLLEEPGSIPPDRAPAVDVAAVRFWEVHQGVDGGELCSLIGVCKKSGKVAPPVNGAGQACHPRFTASRFFAVSIAEA